VLYFPSPRTVTGEDVLEFHVHGGPATVKAVLAGIGCSVHRSGNGTEAKIRYAEPGEFTKRAFLNNRLDLAQVESLSDTLAAETEQQRRAAVRGNSGRLGRTYEGWRQLLLHARAELEALIDFSEDQHFDESPAELLQNVRRGCEEIVTRIRLHEMGSQRSQLLRGGIQIALIGPPNVGKSSLMNLIVGREASIVSPEAGTTRDIVETSLDIGGYLCSFADTAGIRSQSGSEPAQVEGSSNVIGQIEQEGIRRAKARAEDSDVIVVMASFEKNAQLESFVQYDEETLNIASNASKCLIVVNKADRVSASEKKALIEIFATRVQQSYPTLQSVEILSISCRHAGSANAGTGIDQGGLQAVIDRIKQAFASMTSLPPEMADLLGVTERQQQLLVKCRAHLEEFLEQAEQDEPDVVIAAEHLRSAAVYLARITGRGESGDIEEVLGVIFEKFCVGK
jgi:tRNA modification GTPase